MHWGKRAHLRSLSPCRGHAEAKGPVRTTILREVRQTNLGGEKVAGEVSENLQPLHETQRIRKSDIRYFALTAILAKPNCDSASCPLGD